MKSISVIVGSILAFGAHCALAQDDFDITFEVLDDVGDVDAVIIRLDEQRDGAGDEEGDRDDGGLREARDERTEFEERDRRGLDERDLAGERGERRDNDIEDRDVEREIETELEPGLDEEAPGDDVAE